MIFAGTSCILFTQYSPARSKDLEKFGPLFFTSAFTLCPLSRRRTRIRAPRVAPLTAVKPSGASGAGNSASTSKASVAFALRLCFDCANPSHSAPRSLRQ